MKIGIVSDFHLGYERFRQDAYLQAKEALEKASEEADMLLVPGDIFDNRAPKPDVIAEGISLFKELAEKEWKAKVVEYMGPGKAYTSLPIVVIPGTHERRAVGELNPVSLLALAGLAVDASDAVVVVEKGGERVAVRGIGGIAEERLREYLSSSEFKPVENAFNILMFHQSLYELMPFSKDYISFEDLPKGYDLYVCGHIHNRVEDKVHGKPLLIPGSTVLTQLKEVEQEPKGFYLFDTLAGKAEFRPINTRRFVVVKVDVSSKEPGELMEEIERKVAEKIGEDKPIISVVLQGRLRKGIRLGDLPLVKIQREFEGKASVEISGNGIDEATAIADEFAAGKLEGVSVKEFGMGIFLKKLQEFGYALDTPPAALFEKLSTQTKEKAVASAMELLFGKQ
ncbi:MAG: DNA repair exonuclease [Candidatus Micrarchaeia archaeon]|jgi:DNA repair exonuclease SbcCD nuclease subunit